MVVLGRTLDRYLPCSSPDPDHSPDPHHSPGPGSGPRLRPAR